MFGARVKGGPYLGCGVCLQRVYLVLRSFVSCQKPSVEDRKRAMVPALKEPVLIDNSSEAVIYGVEGGHQGRVLAVILR